MLGWYNHGFTRYLLSSDAFVGGRKGCPIKGSGSPSRVTAPPICSFRGSLHGC